MSENATNGALWHRWGPYLSYRQWGTVREDYSAYGTAWDYFPHDHARSRAYRWGEDGIFGFCDRHGIFNIAPAFWNGADPILKERFFGLTNGEGNHGEDVKEAYYHLSALPSHAYNKALYKYPQREFPYSELVEANARATKFEREFELEDTGIFNEDRYFDIVVEHVKIDCTNMLMLVTAYNRGPEEAPLDLLLQGWYRNRWRWNHKEKPQMMLREDGAVHVPHSRWGDYYLLPQAGGAGMFTENETDFQTLFGTPNPTPYTKAAFHHAVVEGKWDKVKQDSGTKFGALYRLSIPPGEFRSAYILFGDNLKLLKATDPAELVETRQAEADEYYEALIGKAMIGELPADVARVGKQGFAGLLWSKQHYHFDVSKWLEGDPGEPEPPAQREHIRNKGWRHVHCSEVLSMPDKWEYPWFAAWDTAFHTVPMALIDPEFAKFQLLTLLREWYMHPNGQMPAYEWAFGDVNPPVHAWAAWRVYTIDRRLSGKGDSVFLERVFLKLLLNFTWWINRKDDQGNNIFEGGFLGLDNIGIFDRNTPLGNGVTLEQADGTSWMAMFCLNMLTIALELAVEKPAYEDIASKFFEHFLSIAKAMNGLESEGLWCGKDNFYYDLVAYPDGTHQRYKVRSVVGLIPIFAVANLDGAVLDKLPGFTRRMKWYLRNMPDLLENIEDVMVPGQGGNRILSLVPRARLEKILERLLDPEEFFSDFGIRSVSKYHKDNPVEMALNGMNYRIQYDPAESTSGLFGGNSNWRGPIWFPINYLIIESLQKLDYYYGGTFKVNLPGHGEPQRLAEAATEIERRLLKLFLKDEKGSRPYWNHPNVEDAHEWEQLLSFHEYFDAETGRGLGARQQTGWTALICKIIDQLFVTTAGGWVTIEK